jgi:hypothetical protein
MRKYLALIVCFWGVILLFDVIATDENPVLHGNFYLDADSDSDIDPGAEHWSTGYFESVHVDKLPVYNDFHSWLKQMTHLYKWRLLKAEQKNNYYFAIFAIGMNSSELAFCFRDISGKDHPLKLKVENINGKNLRLNQYGNNATLVQEYQVNDPETGELIRSRELNGYVVRMRRFPRHLRIIASDESKIIFDENIENIVDSVRDIQDIATHKLPDTNTLEKWVKVVSLPSWKLLNKVANKHGFFAVFKVNDKTFAFCRQLKKNPGIYDRETVLKITDLKGKPLKLNFVTIRSLDRRYRVINVVDKESQKTKYSIIDGSTYRTKNNLPAEFRMQYIMRGDNSKSEVYFDEKVNFSK